MLISGQQLGDDSLLNSAASGLRRVDHSTFIIGWQPRREGSSLVRAPRTPDAACRVEAGSASSPVFEAAFRLCLGLVQQCGEGDGVLVLTLVWRSAKGCVAGSLDAAVSKVLLQ
jgi:hypothetical protein